MLSGIDVVASRFAAQTLLADFLILGSPAAGKAVDEAAMQVSALPHDDGQWNRVYNDRGIPYKFDARAMPATQDVFHPATRPVLPPSLQTGAFGWDRLLPIIEQLRKDGGAALNRRLAEYLTTRQQIAATLVGLSDDPMTTILSVRPEEITAYIRARKDDWRLLDGEPPINLGARCRRLWLLLFRAKLEHRFGV